MHTPPPPSHDQPPHNPLPHGQAPHYQPPHEQPQYGPPPYGQPPYAPPPYGQPQQPPPGYPQYGYAPPPPPPPGASGQWGPSSIGMEPNVSAGLGYLFTIIAIIFFFMEKQNRFVRFHTAQAILLSIGYLALFGLWFIAFWAVVLAGGAASANGDATTANTLAGLGLILLMLCIGAIVLLYLALWIWGMVAAFSGRLVKFPLVGAIAQRWAGGPVVPVAPAAPYGPPPGYR